MLTEKPSRIGSRYIYDCNKMLVEILEIRNGEIPFIVKALKGNNLIMSLYFDELDKWTELKNQDKPLCK